MLALIQIPQHGDTVLATGSGKRAVGRDRDGVDVASVAIVIGLQFEF